MAVGTLVSRGTGFLRTLVLTYAIGTTFLGNAYNNPNTLPNTVYYLMLGGIFTAVVVPLLVRAAKRDPDRGEAYTQRMFTLGALAGRPGRAHAARSPGAAGPSRWAWGSWLGRVSRLRIPRPQIIGRPVAVRPGHPAPAGRRIHRSGRA